MSKDPNKSTKVIYDERVFGGSGSGKGLMDSALMDSETEEEYFKRMHEFNNETGVRNCSFDLTLPYPFVLGCVIPTPGRGLTQPWTKKFGHLCT